MIGDRRRARRIREQGRPASALVLAARTLGAGDGYEVPWRLEVRVEPEGHDPFETVLEGRYPRGGEPSPGARVEVLIDPRRGRRVGYSGDGPPLSASAVTAPPATPVETEGSGERDRSREPDPLETLRLAGRVLAGLADGSLAPDRPAILTDRHHDDMPPAPAPAREGAESMRSLSIAGLVELACDDAPAVADELLRRILAGEADPAGVLREARAAGPPGEAAIRAVTTALQRRGVISARQAAHLSPPSG